MTAAEDRPRTLVRGERFIVRENPELVAAVLRIKQVRAAESVRSTTPAGAVG